MTKPRRMPIPTMITPCCIMANMNILVAMSAKPITFTIMIIRIAMITTTTMNKLTSMTMNTFTSMHMIMFIPTRMICPSVG
ncbi:MAG: hypothetical protein BWY66_02665 [bacterium ADurb.Bin374]|nr:MAG: hypothetical protein BWY66_02665 [bacterium ADurb.Bin374]